MCPCCRRNASHQLCATADTAYLPTERCQVADLANFKSTRIRHREMAATIRALGVALAACLVTCALAIPDDTTVLKARDSIRSIIRGEPKLAPKMVRLSFHDCVGGCDGCIDLGNPDNWGLEIPIAALESVAEDFSSHMSRADTWALAGSVANEESMAPEEALPFELEKYGRKDCGPSATGGSQPWRDLPSPNMDIDGVLDYFSQVFDMSAQETVAVLGAHTLGYAARNISGFDGPGGWNSHPLELDNRYFGNLYNHPWHQVFVDNGDQITPDRWIWRLADIPPTSARDQAPHRSDKLSDVRHRKLQGDTGTHLTLARGLLVPTEVTSHLADKPTPKETQFMFNSDIALVWTFGEQVDLTTGEVGCKASPDAGASGCSASSTAAQVASYAEDASRFFTDYEKAFKKMIETTSDGHPPLTIASHGRA